jgi:hypothetical protein
MFILSGYGRKYCQENLKPRHFEVIFAGAESLAQHFGL